MAGKKSIHSAYVLHARSFRENSVLLELLCKDEGRISAIYKGGRKAKKQSAKPDLFVPYHISLFGAGELKSVASFELGSMSGLGRLQGVKLFSGMYVNELLYKLLQRDETQQDVFAAYEDVLLALRSTENFEAHLRHFEMRLLSSLGYGVQFEVAADGVSNIEAGLNYEFIAGQGFIAIKDKAKPGTRPVSGELLHQLAAGQWSTRENLSALKGITQAAIKPLLRGEPLSSRALFRKAFSRTAR